MSRGLVYPFIMKPVRINNYTHLIALLKLKQEKYKTYTVSTTYSPFAGVLGREREKFDVDEIIEGFLHQKLVARFKEHSKKVEKKAVEFINRKVKEIHRDNGQMLSNTQVGNIRDIGEMLLSNPGWNSFKDTLLMDLWVMLCNRVSPLDFLRQAYLKHMQLFLSVIADLSKLEDDAYLRAVTPQFVEKRFNRDEYRLESYEGRCLWAELFVLFRLGKAALARELLSKYEVFFEFMSQKFKSFFLEYLDGRSVSFSSSLSRNEDHFKRFFFELLEGRSGSCSSVINSAEDFLWRRTLGAGSSEAQITDSISVVADQFENPKIRLMAYLLGKEYKKAINTLLKSDFSLGAKFFILRELCLEQQLDSDDKREHGSVNPIFLNFVFNIVSQLPERENKVKLVEMLRPYHWYYDLVPKYLIKYKIFDILSPQHVKDTVDYSLDAEVSEKVVGELKKSDDKSLLLQLYQIVPDDSMGDVLTSVLEEAILSDETVDSSVVESYLERFDGRGIERLREIYSIYKFNMNGSIGALRSTVLFVTGADLTRYKFVVEKVFQRAVEAVRTAKDREMAKQLFRLCGELDLSEENCAKASAELIGLI